MITGMVRFWVGVSGFSYASWQGVFYPKRTKPPDMLSAYSNKLNSVEVNSSFYHTPTEATTAKWGKQTSEKFRFSFKANRRITHIKKLRDVETDFAGFTKSLEPVGEKLGCVLVQLPPYLKRDLETLEAFLKLKPESANVAMEFRHNSWFGDDLYGLLAKHNSALCVADTEDMKPTFSNQASFVYARLRKDRYSETELESWAGRLSDFAKNADDCYVYFKHDETGEAANMAVGFAAMLRA
jgi:uncharacterized protein YecE (DUF72 family)